MMKSMMENHADLQANDLKNGRRLSGKNDRDRHSDHSYKRIADPHPIVKK